MKCGTHKAVRWFQASKYAATSSVQVTSERAAVCEWIHRNIWGLIIFRNICNGVRSGVVCSIVVVGVKIFTRITVLAETL